MCAGWNSRNIKLKLPQKEGFVIKHDFLSIQDINRNEVFKILSLAQKLKKELKSVGYNEPLLRNKILIMIFQKQSFRTRLSFEVGMIHLGGDALYFGCRDSAV